VKPPSPWCVVGATVTGTAHTAGGLPCQDAHGWEASLGATCLAVADGAGSRPLSQHGATAAVSAILAWSKTLTSPPTSLDEGFTRAAAAVEYRASELGVSGPEDLATTLAVALVIDNVVLLGQIGDGVVVVMNGGHPIAPVPGERFEHANETVFLTSTHGLDHHFREVTYPAGEITGVALATDGLRLKVLADLATGAPYEPFFDDAFAYARTPEASNDGVTEFLACLEDRTGDDKTLLLAVPAP
jgi:hypothetical protein